ncbi:hypothetical protein D9758_011245 [Tetrapyrgos nigripes]|uniref:DUF659 domain-containing protein n=1 Tax=Tetrapyrgos nigripes TaxID=182062 RepID=A0A8H5FZ32_9AGAR|nr:hypothetical protein D9758_011245 [Tetrapyrgos nigripes]
MPRPENQLWAYFYKGEKQNKSHFKAYCFGCIKNKAPAHIKNEPALDIKTMKNESWYKQDAGHVLGVKESMVAHILGGERPCNHASEEAKKEATIERNKLRKQGSKRGRDSEDGNTDQGEEDNTRVASSKKRQVVDLREYKQSTLDGKVFKGISIPFNDEQRKAIHVQFLRATLSANLKFNWVEDPEIKTLFEMFQALADDVIPSAKQLSTSLLDAEYELVKEEVKQDVKDKDVVCDGVKDISKNSLTGVNISVDFQPHLIDLYNSTPDKKDGLSMCESFEKMIDSAESVYGCRIVALGTDNDGGSRAGRNLIGERRPWLFTFPCIAHQGQLILHDYLKVNPEANQTAEDATDLVGWFNNHGRVRVIFDEEQLKANHKILSYILANLTRWTTHVISFHRLEEIEQPLRIAALSHRDDVIGAQVGAEKNIRNASALRSAATEHLDLINDNNFWRRLHGVVEDLEPICYATNIFQSDRARPDVVLLAFVGLYLHFKNHTDKQLSLAMTKRLEKRWKSFDQHLLIAALILNPYERLDHFGPDANANPFGLNSLISELYKKYANRPVPDSLDLDEVNDLGEERRKCLQSISTAVTHYLAMTGPFQHWPEQRASWEAIHGNDPIIFWQQMTTDGRTADLAHLSWRRASEHWPEQRASWEAIHGNDPIIFWQQMTTDGRTADLAHFALTLLSIVLNTASNERSFSDLKVKKTRLGNRLGIPKVKKMIKVGGRIRRHHYNAGLRTRRKPRKNHSEERLSTLLHVPRYAEALDGLDSDIDDDLHRRSPLVRSRREWRREFIKWAERARAEDSGDDDDNEPQASTANSQWLPRSLALLFGGKTVEESTLDAYIDRRRTRRQGWSEEALHMELLAQEEGDVIPDDGELEGSGDEYNGN